MAAVIKEEKRMDGPVKTYLERYQEFLGGYKQFKMEKEALSTKYKTINSREKQ